MKFTYSTIGLVFTAIGGSLTNIKYAVIRTSSGAGAGKVVCFSTLSTAAFTVTVGNTITISPAATGVFAMA
jgi:L-amino acid N-acyltransferase YncA